jgi:hypothetical protein
MGGEEMEAKRNTKYYAAMLKRKLEYRQAKKSKEV